MNHFASEDEHKWKRCECLSKCNSKCNNLFENFEKNFLKYIL